MKVSKYHWDYLFIIPNCKIQNSKKGRCSASGVYKTFCFIAFPLQIRKLIIFYIEKIGIHRNEKILSWSCCKFLNIILKYFSLYIYIISFKERKNWFILFNTFRKWIYKGWKKIYSMRVERSKVLFSINVGNVSIHIVNI